MVAILIEIGIEYNFDDEIPKDLLVGIIAIETLLHSVSSRCFRPYLLYLTVH